MCLNFSTWMCYPLSMHGFKAIAFDLDNTLAEPHRPLTASMSEKLGALLARYPVAIMSAASLERIQNNVLAQAPKPFDLSRLTLFTANAAQCYTYKDTAWIAQYQYGFTDAERMHIQTALEESTAQTGILEDHPPYGPQFVDYEGYLAFSALGIEAPVDVRRSWDPDGAKRQKVRALLKERLPEFDVFIGGLTTIDVTPKGINKAFGIRWYAEHLSCAPSDIFYVGDALYEGGNDAVVIDTGAQTRQVSGPADTESLIDEILAQ